jgi:mRNA interferase MazF
MGRAVAGGAITRGEVWWADLDPVVGHEQGRIRPVLVVSSDAHIRLPSALLAVVPLTRMNLGFPSHVRLGPPEAGLRTVSYVMTEQIRTVSRLRLGKRLGAVESATLADVDHRLRWLLDL